MELDIPQRNCMDSDFDLGVDLPMILWKSDLIKIIFDANIYRLSFKRCSLVCRLSKAQTSVTIKTDLSYHNAFMASGSSAPKIPAY